MTDRVVESSPRLKARIAGALYLIVAVAGAFALSAHTGPIVHADAAATARNILAAQSMFRLGIVADLIANAAYIGVAALLYQLFKPVSRNVSLLAAFFSLVGLAISAGNLVNAIAPLVILDGAPYLTAFTPQQLQALAYTSLRLQEQGYNIATMFFGFYCLSIGCLIVGSTFIPRIVGLLMVIAGLSWLTDSFATILSPAFAAHLSLPTLVAAATGEVSLTLWLMLVGVNAAKWKTQASAAAQRQSYVLG